MNLEQLNAQFSSEAQCRQFFEAARWPNGRICPHCSFTTSYTIKVKACTLKPIVSQHVDTSAHLMSDKHRTFIHIGQQYSAHSHLNHSQREFSRGSVHSNTAESFLSLFEKARVGVYHYFSDKHLSRYLHEAGFRWDNRVPVEKKTKSGKVKTKMAPIPIVDMLLLLIMRCFGSHLKRTKSWGIQDVAFS
jgi:hypothetical protein